MRPNDYRCENFPIESYACAEQLPSSYTPPAPPPAALPVPLSQDSGNAGAGDAAAASGAAASGFRDEPATQVPSRPFYGSSITK